MFTYELHLGLDISELLNSYYEDDIDIAASDRIIDHPVKPDPDVSIYSEEKLAIVNKIVNRILVSLKAQDMEILYDDKVPRNATHQAESTYSFYIKAVWNREQESCFKMYISIRDHEFSKYPETGRFEHKSQSYTFGVDIKKIKNEDDIVKLDETITKHLDQFKTRVIDILNRSSEIIPIAEKAADILGMKFSFERTNRKALYIFYSDELRHEIQLSELEIFEANSVDDVVELVKSCM